MTSSRLPARPRVWAIALVLLVAGGLCSTALDDGWSRIYEGNGQFFSGVARVHLEKGLGFTKGQDWIYNEDNPFEWRGELPVEARLYGHHPPLLGISLAAAFAVFGREPQVARSVTIASHLVFLLLLMLAVRRWTSGAAWFFTGLIAASTPMSVFFGRNVCHEAWVTPWLMIAIIVYLRRIERGDQGTRREDAMVCAASALAAAYGWPGFYLPPILIVGEALHGRLLGRSSRWLGTTAIGMLLLIVAQIAWAQPDGGLALLLFGARARVAPATFGYGFRDWIVAVLDAAARGYSSEMVAVAVVVALAGLVRACTTGSFGGPLAGFVTIWLALGAIHVAAFPSGAWAHPYWIWYFMPAISTAAGLAAATLWESGRGRRALLARAVVVLGLLGYAGQSRATLREWFDVARRPTGSVVFDWPLPTRVVQSPASDAAPGGTVETGVSLAAPLLVDAARARDDEAVVLFDSELVDQGCPGSGMHQASKPGHLTACADGMYLISAQVKWQPSAAGERLMGIRFFGGETGRRIVSTRAVAGRDGRGSVQTVATRHPLAAGEHVAVVVRQDSGSALELKSARFGMVKLDSGNSASQLAPQDARED